VNGGPLHGLINVLCREPDLEMLSESHSQWRPHTTKTGGGERKIMPDMSYHFLKEDRLNY
jgi:hypothetical protein